MSNDEAMDLIEDCIARERKLSAWERDFVLSLQTQLESGRTPTEAQSYKLSEIWERIT